MLSRDENEEHRKQLAKCEYIAKQLTNIPGVEATVVPNDGRSYEHPEMAHVPTVRVDMDKDILGITTGRTINQEMMKGDPPISLSWVRFGRYEYGPYQNKAQTYIFSYYLRDGEEKIVAERMKQLLTTCPWKKAAK